MHAGQRSPTHHTPPHAWHVGTWPWPEAEDTIQPDGQRFIATGGDFTLLLKSERLSVAQCSEGSLQIVRVLQGSLPRNAIRRTSQMLYLVDTRG